MTRSQVPSQTQDGSKSFEQQNCEELEGMLPALSTRRGRGGVLRLRDGTRKSDKLLVIHTNLHSTNHKVVSSLYGAPLVQGQATGDSRLTRLTRLTTVRTRGKPPPFPI
jgi:hypothetical protein